MPCATIHMLTAGRVLDRWTRHPSLAPVPVREEDIRHAFLLGAMGPDIGFVPGVDRFVSELSHYVSTADLTRALLREAETHEQRAFAWGWATHHLTDVELHPLVGFACGEHLLGDRNVRLNASDDVGTHVAIEVGLDLVFLDTDTRIPHPPGRLRFEGGSVGFIARALEHTYGFPWTSGALRRALARAYALTRRWPGVLRIVGSARGTASTRGSRIWRSLLRGVLDVAGMVASPDSPAGGLLRPLHPPSWLVARVRELAEGFPALFQARVEDGLLGLQNRNLETGRLEHDPVDHPDSARTILRLQTLTGG